MISVTPNTWSPNGLPGSTLVPASTPSPPHQEYILHRAEKRILLNPKKTMSLLCLKHYCDSPFHSEKKGKKSNLPNSFASFTVCSNLPFTPAFLIPLRESVFFSTAYTAFLYTDGQSVYLCYALIFVVLIFLPDCPAKV